MFLKPKQLVAFADVEAGGLAGRDDDVEGGDVVGDLDGLGLGVDAIVLGDGLVNDVDHGLGVGVLEDELVLADPDEDIFIGAVLEDLLPVLRVVFALEAADGEVGVAAYLGALGMADVEGDDAALLIDVDLERRIDFDGGGCGRLGCGCWGLLRGERGGCDEEKEEREARACEIHGGSNRDKL